MIACAAYLSKFATAPEGMDTVYLSTSTVRATLHAVQRTG